MSVHETAIVHESVKIGENSTIGPFCVIEEGCEIGKDVVIQGGVRIGKSCKIDDRCVIKWGAILTQNVYLDKNVFFGVRSTCLGSDADREDYHGIFIGENSYIGGHSVIFPAVEIHENIIVGAMSLVNRDLKKEGTYFGQPAVLKTRKKAWE